MFISRLCVCINFVFNIYIADANTKPNTAIVQLRPEEVINTFRSMVSSNYLRQLANEFAVKAAEHFLSEIKKNENFGAIMNSLKEQIPDAVPDEEEDISYVAYDEDKIPRNNEILDQAEALTLLEAPLPDGDNLDAVTMLSEEDITGTNNKNVPVMEGLKINGIYYRRLL